MRTFEPDIDSQKMRWWRIVLVLSIGFGLLVLGSVLSCFLLSSSTTEAYGPEAANVGVVPKTATLRKSSYTPPQTRDPALAALVNREAALSERVSSDITARLPRVKDPGDFPALVSVLQDTKDHDTVRNEVANLLRRSNYPGLAAALIKVLNNPKEEARFRSFAVQHLWHQSKKAGPDELRRIRSTLHKALDDRHVPVRREALLALTRMKDSKAAETAAKWLAATGKDADAVRDLAIRCVHELDLREHLPAIRRYARDPDVVVRIAAIVALSQWGDEESKQVFQEAADSSVVRLQRAGKAALARLAR